MTVAEGLAFLRRFQDYLGDVAAGCRAIRRWIADAYDDTTADQDRTIYGGSVTPAYAEGLLDSPHVDGLGAGRKGRDPEASAEIIRLIAQAKGAI